MEATARRDDAAQTADSSVGRGLQVDPLFDEHAGWARSIALAIHARIWRSGVERADCIQNAMVGLLEAIERFDETRGIPFRAYAIARVRGSVFNALRSACVNGATPAIDRRGERVATFVEDYSGDDHLDVFSALVGSLGVGFILEDAWDRDAEDASSAAERAEVTGRVLAAVGQLPERHRELLRHHYFLHRPFADLVADWKISKGRISQLHTDALMRLKSVLLDLW